jgi:hypothetical protein
MYLPNFLDGFERLVAFDAETTGKSTPEAEFILNGSPHRSARQIWGTLSGGVG